MKPRVAILISGNGSNMVALLKSMSKAEITAEPVLVISTRADAAGLSKAKLYDVPTMVIDDKSNDDEPNIFEEKLHTALLEAKADFICLAGFMRILSTDFIEKWAYKILNIHPSLLPKYKGLNTHKRAIDAKESLAGCTVHIVTAKLDDGPILKQKTVAIKPEDTPETLAERVLLEEHKIYPLALKDYIESYNEGAYVFFERAARIRAQLRMPL